MRFFFFFRSDDDDNNNNVDGMANEIHPFKVFFSLLFRYELEEVGEEE